MDASRSKEFTKAEWIDLFEQALEAREKLQGIEAALTAEILMLEGLHPSKLAEYKADHAGNLVELVGDLLRANEAADELVMGMSLAGMDMQECPINWDGGLTAEEILERSKEGFDRQAYLEHQARTS